MATSAAVFSSPSALRRTQKVHRSQAVRETDENKEIDKENEAPQSKHGVAQVKSCMSDISEAMWTPMPLRRPCPEVSPEALSGPYSTVQTLGLQIPKVVKTALIFEAPACLEAVTETEPAVTSEAPVEPVIESEQPVHQALAHIEAVMKTGPMAGSEQVVPRTLETVRGLRHLHPLDFIGDEMPVKNTFINFCIPAFSPPTRTTTKPLCGDSEPRNYAPKPFSIQDCDEDASQYPRSVSPEYPRSVSPVPEPVRGLRQLPRLEFVEGQMSVKNTFINVCIPSSSPPTRATTKPLSGESEPRNYAPKAFMTYCCDQDEGFSPSPFRTQCSDQDESFEVPSIHIPDDFHEGGFAQCRSIIPESSKMQGSGLDAEAALDRYVAGFLAATPNPFYPKEVVANPTVISLQETVISAPPAPKQDAKRIQLNLATWLPASASSKTSAPSEPPVRVCLAQHLPTVDSPDTACKRTLFRHNPIERLAAAACTSVPSKIPCATCGLPQ